MDFTPPSNPPIQANPISSIPSSRKLPIKRKTPNSTLTLTTTPFPDDDDDARNPPFKFHRIWTEPDEIRLLQGLLVSSSQGLSFPRDLGIFYTQFADGMSQPYSKSQLSEKLRRLRKKFRVISSRLSKGLDKSLLSPQDRALYDLSKQLWDPDHVRPSLPSNRKPSSSPEVPSSSTAVLALPSVGKKTVTCDSGNKVDGSFKNNLNVNENDAGDVDVDVELVHEEVGVKNAGGDLSSGIVHFASTTLADVLDRSLKEVRMMVDVRRCSDREKDIGFEKRWKDQLVEEFDVLAKRLKLILEHSSMGGK